MLSNTPFVWTCPPDPAIYLFMSVLHYYSPSQVESFRGCQRKWVFKSMLGIYTEQGRGAKLGDEVHKQLETYLKGGVLDFTHESGYIAAELVPLLPDPATEDVQAERKMGFEFKGFLWVGKVDWTWKKKDGTVVIGDHKSTSNINYAKTSRDLATDVQAMAYAYDAMALHETPEISLCWDYVQTKKPYKTLISTYDAESKYVVEQMKRITEESLVPMSRLLRFKRQKGVATSSEDVMRVVSEVPPSPLECEAYGGCPYRANCTDIGAATRIKSIMKNEGKEGMFSKLKEKREKTVAAAEGINPPEVEAPPAEDKAVLDELTALGQAEEAKVEEKPKRGRKKKVAEEGTTVEVPEAAEIGAWSLSLNTSVLFLDCLPPDNSVVTETLRMLQEAKEIVNSQLEVCDYRVVPYGQGSGALAAAVEQMAKSGAYGTSFFLDSRTPEGALLQNVLLPVCKTVVRGLR